MTFLRDFPTVTLHSAALYTTVPPETTLVLIKTPPILCIHLYYGRCISVFIQSSHVEYCEFSWNISQTGTAIDAINLISTARESNAFYFYSLRSDHQNTHTTGNANQDTQPPEHDVLYGWPPRCAMICSKSTRAETFAWPVVPRSLTNVAKVKLLAPVLFVGCLRSGHAH